MAFYDWQNCPPPVRAQVDELTSALSKILVDTLIGIYLHGSLAMGSFNPACSDIDLLVITTNRMSRAEKRQSINYLLAHSLKPQPIEISFLAREQLLPWKFPTPFDLHYSEMWRARYVHDLDAGTWQAWGAGEQRDPDLAAHITVINARGICLVGSPISENFSPVPVRDYYASLASDMEESLKEIANNPVYTILNCCRTYAYIRTGRVLSKEEGGRWALDVLPIELQEFVRVALQEYCSEGEQRNYDGTGLSMFARYMREPLKSVLQHFEGTS